MKIICLLLLSLLPGWLFCQPITTKYEQSNATETPTYHEIIQWWKMMDNRFPQVKMLTMGQTDAGFPLHLVIVSNDKDFDFASLRKKDRRIILINNGIHPGEPDGVDATMLLVRDIVSKKKQLPANVVLAIIPIYNIGGCLNRSEYNRVDQNGPKAFGFRGNSQNLDLNRDFIKCDSKEARSFTEIFHLTDPDVFIDNHVSNGADYQHIMTLIASQHNKLSGAMGDYMHKQFEPGLYTLMKKKGYDLVPYVTLSGTTPDEGITLFYDSPRYSTGYASIWHTFAFVPETHMLKSYAQRVESTYALMECFIEFTSVNSEAIRKLRQQTKEAVKKQEQFTVSWTLDKNNYEEITFKGYEATFKPSTISGLPRLFYDTTRPYEKKIKYFNTLAPEITIQKPSGYIIPQGWWKVIALLKLNKVTMHPLRNDTTIEVEEYHIDNFKTNAYPYEMHHQNYDVKVSTQVKNKNFRKGDYYIPMNQVANRFIMEVLEPQGHDSYFSWNYFDGILGQKEGFSGYAFEDIAAEYLRSKPELKKKLEERKSNDTSFAKDAFAQLDFVYWNSPYAEPVFMRYPVYRVKGER
jgi:hypothetical protein